MKAVTTFTPVNGGSATVDLPLQTGYYEVINDSNFLLIITCNSGTCYQSPGEAQAYPTPPGGGSIFIQTMDMYTYLFGDGGISNNVTVNQFLDGETYGQNWPYYLSRSTNISRNTNQSGAISASAANLVGGLTCTLNSVALGLPEGAIGYLYLTAVDISIDQESSAHGFTVNISPLNFGSLVSGNQTISLVGHTMTNQSIFWPLRWPDQPLVGTVQGAGATISVAIPAVAGSTARAAINMVGYFQ